MCGIFGFVATTPSLITRPDLGHLIPKLLLLSESRGKDAAGVALIEPHRLTILKRPLRAKAMIARPDYQRLLREFVNRKVAGETIGFMGHARMVTNGTEQDHANNQPVLKHEMICLHNGIIVNDAALWNDIPTIQRAYEVDTEAFLSLVQQGRDRGLLHAFTNAFNRLQGANTVALLSADHDAILLTSSNGSLYFSLSASGHELAFASEKYILEQFLRHPKIQAIFAGQAIQQILAPQAYAFTLSDLTPISFDLNHPPHNVSLAVIPPRVIEDRVIQHRKPAPSEAAPRPASSWAKNDLFMQNVKTAVGRLRRCSRCLLPESFPFIRYDEQGVCNYCRNYNPLAARGRDTLEKLVAPHRSSSGCPDCLVPISGGRDSSYGLHYVKQELGLNPVAYTYDWGMVTDLARRNISRMCGALGIEHILVSADIRKKLDNIRKNVAAWLKKPDLGTVPLFMAGDKQFFYYAAMLKRQMKLNTVFFNFNPLERTDFKVGFCGIDENYQKEIYYELTGLNKIRLAFYYGRQFVQNPAFLNATLFDSAFAFFSYYLIPKSYLTLYDFISWNESIVADVLIPQYDWETSPDTRTTWRIGDGTAAFYNYIYYVMAGFSENDTLRSNQIREGMLPREKALALVEDENEPRYEAMAWYCNRIGIDLDEAIRIINAAPKRYSFPG
ncbi:MAG: hypothetical protein HY866_14215 [Chloroflexi bacterium]|nr:hypothetical protein [Chloroflexota bacterium]